jgi:hypothetical protein
MFTYAVVVYSLSASCSLSVYRFVASNVGTPVPVSTAETLTVCALDAYAPIGVYVPPFTEYASEVEKVFFCVPLTEIEV